MDPGTIITLGVIAALVLIALAVTFHYLKATVKKGDIEFSIEGSKSREPGMSLDPPIDPLPSPQAHPAIKNQTNVADSQYNALHIPSSPFGVF
jgi:hypothetical protein